MHNPCTKIEKTETTEITKYQTVFYFSENSKGTTRQQNT